jgi:hypothetical protein
MKYLVLMKKRLGNCFLHSVAWINKNAKIDGPLSGTVDSLIGRPSEDSVECNNWLKKAGDD